MYKTWDEAGQTARGIVEGVGNRLPEGREALILPPFTSIRAVAEVLSGRPGFPVGGQDLYPAEEGAFTGEISARMLLDLGCAWVLTGHSERRHVLGEDDRLVGRKTAFGLKAGLGVILCIGEKIDERRSGQVEAVLERQLREGLAGLPELPGLAEAFESNRLVIAYEPVWAIGTGEVAGPKDIVEAHGFVRRTLESIPALDAAQTRILYGGSVKPDNCAEIIGLDNVDGVLVGGASLQAESFTRIILA
jgi:triosephosphate isomerase